jgi:hypothetical protein
MKPDIAKALDVVRSQYECDVHIDHIHSLLCFLGGSAHGPAVTAFSPGRLHAPAETASPLFEEALSRFICGQ